MKKMSDSEFDFDLDISLQDTVIDKPFSLPQHNIIEELRKYLEPNTRISTESKKRIQRFSERILQNILRELSGILKDFYEISHKKTLDIELTEKSIQYFQESNKGCALLFGSIKK